MTDSAGGASGPNSNYDLLLGSDMLKRFTVTFDYSRSKMYFEPNADHGKPFEADKTGLRLFATLPDMQTFRVMGVLKGSAAETAGLQPGDVIETIDGKPAGSMKLYKWREQFRAADAKGWDFGVRRGGTLVKVRLEAKSII
jgi:C-terminal processing protease CtpA/Prc